MKVPKSLEERFRRWVDKTPGVNFGNLDYALKDPESVASEALSAFKAGWRAAKADMPRVAHNGSTERQ